jgi:hypothetical protein
MRKFIFLLVLLFPPLALGQSFAGSYRAIFFNLFSEPRTIIAEFEVKQDNSLNGKIKVDSLIKDFTGTVDKKGNFEAVLEQAGNFTYKLKGKFDKNNKISLVQRSQVGSGFNKSISENSLEGNFSKIVVNQTKNETDSTVQPQPKVELIDNGKSWLKIQQSNPFFGTEWTDFTATVGFGNSAKTPVGSESKRITGTADASDYLVLRVKSKIEGQQSLSINIPLLAPDKRVWRQSELRNTSYREVSGDNRNSFLAAATLQTDSRYAGGTLEVISENETRIVFKLTDFKIKRLTKDDFVTLNGFVYADKMGGS